MECAATDGFQGQKISRFQCPQVCRRRGIMLEQRAEFESDWIYGLPAGKDTCMLHLSCVRLQPSPAKFLDTIALSL